MKIKITKKANFRTWSNKHIGEIYLVDYTDGNYCYYVKRKNNGIWSVYGEHCEVQ